MFHCEAREATLRKVTIGRHRLLGIYADLILVVRLDGDDDLEQFGFDPAGVPEDMTELRRRLDLGNHVVHLRASSEPFRDWSHTQRRCQLERPILLGVAILHPDEDEEQMALPGMPMASDAILDLQFKCRIFDIADKTIAGLVNALGLSVRCEFVNYERLRDLVVAELRADGTFDRLEAEYQDKDDLRDARKAMIDQVFENCVDRWEPGASLVDVLALAHRPPIAA